MIEEIEAVRVGDRIYLSVEFVDVLKANPRSRTLLAVVESIQRDSTDGVIVLSLRNA